MAIEKIIAKGAGVRISSHATPATTATVECIRGDYEIDLGSYDTSDEVCHEQGSYSIKDTSPKYGDITWKLYLDSDSANAFQKILEDAHYNLNDFADPDNWLTIEVKFVDSHATTWTFNAVVIARKLSVVLTKYVDLEITMKQMDKPVRT